METADLVVVGGGVVGLSVAYEASRLGIDVLVLDRRAAAACNDGSASWAAAGMLAPYLESTLDPLLVDLALRSAQLYPEFIAQVESDAGMSCQYRTLGSLLVALHRDHLAALEHLVARQRQLGLIVEPLSAAELREREPCLSPRVVSGYCATSDHQVDPRALLLALRGAVRARGGRIVQDAEVLGVRHEAGRLVGLRLRHHGSESDLGATRLLLAAGAWSKSLWDSLGASLGVLPLRPVKGQLLRLHGVPLLQQVVRTPDVYLVPRLDGELLVGATMEEQGWDDRVTAGATLQLLQEAWRTLPGIEDLELRELCVGFRPALRDNVPALGPTAIDGLWLATGHYRHGVLLAPATARLLADWLHSGKAPAALAPFAPARLVASSSRWSLK